jgi:hypothetical protein
MSNENIETEIKAIEGFQSTFDEYYKYFIEFYNGNSDNTSIYYLGHPDLIKLSSKLQASYVKLPDILRERLLKIEFDVFLHCNNIVDLYSLRKYIIEEHLFNTLATLVERVDGELKTAIEIFKTGDSSLYEKLPERNYKFYRSWEEPKLIRDIRNDSSVEVKESDLNPKAREEKETEVKDKLNDNENDKFIDRLEKVDTVASKAESIFQKSLSMGSLVIKYWPFKYL